MNKRNRHIKQNTYTRFYPDAHTILKNSIKIHTNRKVFKIDSMFFKKTIAWLLLIIAFCSLFYTIKHNHKKTYTKIIAQQDVNIPFDKKMYKAVPKNTHQEAPKKTSKKLLPDTERTFIVYPKNKDSMSNIFKNVGLNNQILLTLLKQKTYAKYLSNIKPSRKITFIIQNHELKTLILPISIIQTLHIDKIKNQYKFSVINTPTTTRQVYIANTINGSIYSTAKKINMPNNLVSQMVDALSHEINIARDAKTGDKFSLIYTAQYLENKQISTGKIIALRYTNKNKIYSVIAYKKSKNSQEEYYSAEGKSFKKAFLRYPVKFTHISSPFRLSRMHPILHYKRPHKGVDLAAPIGTPIHATADGIITKLARENGYGNMIQISHYKIYTSVYAHLLRYVHGLSKGSRVTKGQLIGYVGQSGLADGPHCHYELRINNQARNPSTIALPTATPLSVQELRVFKNYSKKIFDKLKLFEDATLMKHHA